jgi:hypothetical protein
MPIIPLPTVATLKVNGVFDFESVYRAMHDWFVGQKYYFEEILYKHKVPSPAGAEEHIRWKGWRKVTEYVKFNIYVYIIMWDMKEIEVIKNGEKKKLTKARIKIEFNGDCELDYSKQFEKTPFLKKLGQFYNEFVAKKKIDTVYTDQLYYMILKLYTVAKEQMELETKSNMYYDMW